jgi:flagellar motility protein MotE (MotC chaperone)
MAVASKKPGLSREQVAELYTDVRKAMAQMKSGAAPKRKVAGSDAEAAKAIAMEIKKAMARDPKSSAASAASDAGSATSMQFSRFSDVPPPETGNRGALVALGFVCLLGVMKITLSGVEALGLFDVQPAMASVASADPKGVFGPGYSKEEVRVLQSLDSRRTELEQRSKKLDERSRELEVRDREFTIRSAQLRDLADRLKTDRERTEKRRDAQVEQLANVYSSMGPQEAAQLLEQLDVAIALPLIERMPEKKIGQILGLMGRERALMLTKMLSVSR